MDYQESVDYLESFWKFGIKLGLERITRLLSLLDDPHKKFKAVHVAGTNGKGSVCAMTESILRSAGYRTGMYTSPHLLEYTERIKIDGRDISKEKFAALVDEVRKAVDEKYGGLEKPTEFELLTAAAFRCFAGEKVDIAVIEAGLGGRLDSTNVIDPLVSVITNVSRDHMQVLGDDVKSIAAEKAGIIKNGIPVITAAEGEALDVILSACRGSGSAVDVISEKVSAEIDDGRISLKGKFQKQNAAVAVAAVRRLRDSGFDTEECHVSEGLKNARWPGRFQVMKDAPLIIFDGAHNTAGAAALAAEIKGMSGRGRLFLVIGILKDKEYGEIIRALAGDADIVLAARIGNPRSCDPVSIAEEARKYCKDVRKYESVADAFKAAEAEAAGKDVILAAGSLFTVAEALSACH